MVTIKEIARKADVSTATVSLVLNRKAGAYSISEKTQNRINEIAEELGYSRNALAKAMVKGKFETVSFILGRDDNEYITRFFFGLNQAGIKHGFSLMTFPVETPEMFMDAVEKSIEHRVSGIICRGIPKEPVVRACEKTQKHSIRWGFLGKQDAFDWGVHGCLDNSHAMSEILQHLTGLGHKKIGFVSYNKTQRFRAFQEVAKDMGLSISPEWIIIGNDENEAASLAVNALGGSKSPTAFVCATDPVALRLLVAAKEKGFGVPEDVSITGYANLRMCQYSDPQLTSIDEAFEKTGYNVMDMLLQSIIDDDPFVLNKPKYVYSSPNLVVRASTGQAGK